MPGQPGLADAAGTTQRHHPAHSQRRLDPDEVGRPSDKRADRDGGRRHGTQLLAQHLLVQPGQLRGRVGAQFGGQRRPQPGVRVQRLGRPARRHPRPDQNRDRPLAQRVRRDQRLGGRGGLGHPAQCEQRRGPVLPRARAQAGEPGDLGLDGRVLDLGERAPPPEGERGVERGETAGRVRRGRGVEVRHEAGSVEGGDVEPVAARARRDRRGGRESPAQTGHEGLQRGDRIGGLLVRPHQVGQRVAVDVGPGVQRERGQQPPLPSARQRYRRTVGAAQDDRSEHGDHDHVVIVAGTAVTAT